VRDDAAGIEWSGTDLGALFAQPVNALRPAFWSMLRGILRFNRETTALLREECVAPTTLGEFLDARSYSAPFRDWYLLPMAEAIWSAPRCAILDFPLPMFLGFCHRHGLLQITDRPQWRTVRGGAREYVERIAQRLTDVRVATPVRHVRRRGDHVEIDTVAAVAERFDEVVLACHSDEALCLLADPSHEEAALLGSVAFQPNRVILHTDARLMPARRRAWSAWNYLATRDASAAAPVSVTYWINALQPLPFRTPVLVSLNPPFEPRREAVLAEFEYAHPLVKSAAVSAQRRFAHLQGARRTWYAGAWLGQGFHEDGLASAHEVAHGIAARETPAIAELAA